MFKNNTKEELSIKIGGFFLFWRKILQFEMYVTELLNVCYISINSIDIIEKKNKIVIS